MLYGKADPFFLPYVNRRQPVNAPTKYQNRVPGEDDHDDNRNWHGTIIVSPLVVFCHRWGCVRGTSITTF